MMKRIVALALTFIPIIAIIFYQGVENTRAPAGYAISHVVFDLDGTLVESLGHKVPGDIVLESGEAYRVFPHARELVEHLWQKGLAIHFFSGGSRARNLELLSKLKTNQGKSFLELASSTYHFEDLTDLGEQAAPQRFTERYRKDLTKIAAIDELIILEDNPTFPLDEAQRARALELPVWTQDSLNSFKKEQRLAWAYEAIDRVLMGESPASVNKENTVATIKIGLEKLGLNHKKILSRHDCAGIFFSLSY